ncbi:MAG: DUF5683 domain-containing protein [Candidatus Krumholzibacteria bacterium]|nr:DUF5683 domain-containing protein [Candidatus Krumholzibacteria bacterium]
MGKRTFISTLSVAMLATMAVLCPWPCFGGTGDSLCVRISGTVEGEGAVLSRGYELGGILPVTLCNIEAGERYRLALDGPGLERRIGSFMIGKSGNIEIGGIRLSALGRNAVLPGWGSFYADRGAAGLSDDMGLAASLAILYQEEMEYRHMRNRLDVQNGRLAAAATYEERELFQAAVHETSRKLNVQNEEVKRLAILSGALYAWQVVEPLLVDNPPSGNVGAGKNDITLGGVRKSRAKAFVYSLVRPGRGQIYQGKVVRGVFFSSAALAGGLVALHYQNEYDVAAETYEVCVERFNATSVLSDRERLAGQVSVLWSDVDRAKDRRNVSLIILAGVWGWNVIDTFFEGDCSTADSHRYSLDLDERGASVAFRF